MTSPADEETPYQFRVSRAIAEAAVRTVVNRLQRDPDNFGEPLYRLPALRLQVRCGVVSPLCIHFAVHEDQPLVFAKAVKLLSRRASD